MGNVICKSKLLRTLFRDECVCVINSDYRCGSQLGMIVRRGMLLLKCGQFLFSLAHISSGCVLLVYVDYCLYFSMYS